MLLEAHEGWAARGISESSNSQNMSSRKGNNDIWHACMCNSDMEIGSKMPVKRKGTVIMLSETVSSQHILAY